MDARKQPILVETKTFIYYKNKSLITLCKKIGFQKQHNVRHLYYLRSLK